MSPDVIKVSRDEAGITYELPRPIADTEAEASAPEPEEPAAPAAMTRAEAEAAGLQFTVEREESMRPLGQGDLYVKEPALYAGEWCGEFRGAAARTFHFQASSLQGLLAEFSDFTRRDQ
jgi:hypothetical protein